MKSLAIILLPIHLLAALLGSYEPQELSKFGNLVEHFDHHVSAHGQADLSFVDFLIDHFGSQQRSDDEHEALPLLGGCTSAVPVAEIEYVRVELRPQPVDVPPSPLPSLAGAPRRTTTDIFQPPRIG